MAKEYLATEAEPFHFTDSGLDNVFLIGIKYFKHEDGTVSAEIPAAKQLMRLIARDLLFSEGTLTGDEIRFLRKRLSMKAMDFARLVALDAAAFSRVENSKNKVSEQVNKLTRMSYLLLCKDPELKEDAERLMELIQSEIARRKKMRLVMKITPDNEWEDVPTAA
jgi:DNA-binding transcriptional regulator YiaG